MPVLSQIFSEGVWTFVGMDPSIRKPIQEIKIRFMDQRTVFLQGETVGFCLNAPAGPLCFRAAPSAA